MTASKTAPKTASKKKAASAKPSGASPAKPKPKPVEVTAKRTPREPSKRAPVPVPVPVPVPDLSSSSSSPSSPAPRARRAPLAHEPAVVAQIRELEAQLDRMIDEASKRDVSALDRDVDVSDVEDDDDGDGVDHVDHVLGASADGASADAVTIPTTTATATVAADAAFDAEATLPIARPLRAAPNGGRRSDVAPELRSGFVPETPAAMPYPPPSSAMVEPRASSVSFGSAPVPVVPPPPESVFDTARELLSTDFYLRKWGKLAMRGRSEEVDDFGFDPTYDAKLKPALDFLYSKYFRVETTGIEHVPTSGRCLLVANHSGTLPLDGVMLKTAVKREQLRGDGSRAEPGAEASAGRDVRWLTEDFIYHMPFLGGAMNRLGAVRACQENAERLLAKEQLVAVFPEGVKGIGKLFADRYRLQRFGRGGFIKLCLRMGTPIIPVAVLGAEETNPLLFKIEHLSKALGIPYVPVTPTFPLLGPLGLLPAPTKWRIQFGEPLDLSSHGPEAADDEILVGKLAERVRAAIQGMLDRAVGSRKSVFFG